MDLKTRLYLLRPPKLALNGIARARRGLRAMRARVGPAFADIIDRSFLALEARALGIAAELDVAEQLSGGPRTAADLASALDVDADGLDRMLDLLAASGCFRRRPDGRWRNNATSESLRDSHPMSMREWARFFGGGPFFKVLADADVSVRTGESATKHATGAEFFEWVTQLEPEVGDRFNGAMYAGSRLLGESLVRTVDLNGVATVCDVGGGTGRMLLTILERNPTMRGVLFDLPEVVAGAEPHGRMEVVGGSFFETAPGGCDRYVLVSVVHDWDDARAIEILRTVRDAMPDGARVLVVEQVVDPKDPPLFQRHSDWMMLVLTGAGRERTDEHFRRLFASSGFDVSRTWRLATLHAVYELAPK